MAVRVKDYGKMMDEMNKGQSLTNQHKKAVFKSSTMTEEDKFDKPSMMDSMILAGLKAVKKLKRKRKE